MASRQSDKTKEGFIADLFVGLVTGYIKTSALCRSERLPKHNQLIRVEEDFGRNAVMWVRTSSTANGSRKWTLHKELQTLCCGSC